MTSRKRVQVQVDGGRPARLAPCFGQCEALSSWARVTTMAAPSSCRRAFHSTSMRAASLPGSRPLWAGSRDHPSLRGDSPTGLLQPGPFDLGLPSGRDSGGSGGWGGSAGGCCWLLGPHLAHPGDHHRSGRASLGGKELQGAREGVSAAG